jgi:2-dehydropantoate 2-reductase
MTIAIVGAGAVGGLLAALLHRAEQDVLLVGRPGSIAAVREAGLRLTSGQFGEWTSDVPASTELPPGADVVLAVKDAGLPAVLPLLAGAGPRQALSLLNGVTHADQVRAALPDVPVTGAAVTVEVLRPQPGAVEHRSPFLRLAVPDPVVQWPMVQALSAAGVEVQAGGAEREVLWRKFRFLAPMALLTSYWQEPLGSALDHDAQLTSDVVAEVAQVATLEGLTTTADELRAMLGSMPPSMRSSLQHDLAAGSAGELDALGGTLLRLARQHGVGTPALSRVHAALENATG